MSDRRISKLIERYPKMLPFLSKLSALQGLAGEDLVGEFESLALKLASGGGCLGPTLDDIIEALPEELEIRIKKPYPLEEGCGKPLEILMAANLSQTSIGGRLNVSSVLDRPHLEEGVLRNLLFGMLTRLNHELKYGKD